MSAAAATAGGGGAAEQPAYFATGWTGGDNPWAIALVVTMATFMEVLDTSIANVSLPHIAGNLSVSQDESTWVLTCYLVSNAVVLPISGWLSTPHRAQALLHDLRRALHASARSSAASRRRSGALIFFRILQGIGGGGLGPSEQAILADTFPPAKRGHGDRRLRHGGRARAGHRPDAGRLHHRQLLLALGLLHQRAGRHRCRSSSRTAS